MSHLLAPLARVAAFCAAAGYLAVPLAVDAELPTYAAVAQAETIRGTIYAVPGRFELTLADDRGFNDTVRLHNGTIITPTGLFLEAGQVATISGHADGKSFRADEIDVDPTSIGSHDFVAAPFPYGAQYGYGYGYPVNEYGYPAYPATGYPYAGYYPAQPYGGYGTYGYGGGYYGGTTIYGAPQIAPIQANPAVPLLHRPVASPPQGALPGYRYPTGGSRVVAPVVPLPPPAYRRPPPARPAAPIPPPVRPLPPLKRRD